MEGFTKIVLDNSAICELTGFPKDKVYEDALFEKPFFYVSVRMILKDNFLGDLMNFLFNIRSLAFCLIGLKPFLQA